MGARPRRRRGLGAAELAVGIAECGAAATSADDLCAMLVALLARHNVALAGLRVGLLEDAACPHDIRHGAESAAAPCADTHFVPFFGGSGAVVGGMLVECNAADALSTVPVLRELAPHVANATARVNAAAASAELLIARRRFISLAVHDLKNPLAVVLSNLAVLSETVADAEALEAVGDAQTAARQLHGMLVDLLDFTRAEAGELPYAPALGDVVALVRECAEAMRAVIAAVPASLVIHVTAASPDVSFDAALVIRVLQNLMGNAARFVPAGGGVEIDVGETPTQIIIGIGNNGPPIPADTRARLFERYGQAGVDQSYENRGFGLYLCRLVMDRHGGTITVDDRRGGGVRFELRLPRRR